MARLAGKVALITGAASGIGRASAYRFAREGAAVLVADIDEAGGAAVAETIRADGGRAGFHRTDVSDPDSVEAAVAAAVAEFGGLNVLYCNAGGTSPRDGRVVDAPIDQLWNTLRLDLFGVWLGCRAAIPRMIAAGGGSIINASSMTALIGRDGADAYTAAKGAVAALTRSLAVSHGRDGIRVNAVAPGATLTERVVRRLDQSAFPQQLLDRHLLGLLQPEDIANVALFLASDEARGITGQVIAVDSGVSIT